MPSPPAAAAATVRAPTAAPLKVYGNNATVACACGSIVLVRSLGAPGQGQWTCDCGRRLKGYPDGGARITHILVWEDGNSATAADYAVEVGPRLFQG